MPSKKYRKFKINKNNGKTRTVYSVNNKYKVRLKALMPGLEKRLLEQDSSGVNYAFERGKNCVEGALKHVGYKYTLSMDLLDFFDSVTKEHVSGLIDDEVLDLCLIDDAPKQGLPTSPLIATIALLKCDETILNEIKDVAYTRYADDLTFSFNNRSYHLEIQSRVTSIVESFGFKINTHKTRLQNFKNGRIIINGVGVDKDGVHPTRKILKKIRAAEHQKNKSSLVGLREWSKCKLPKKRKGL